MSFKLCIIVNRCTLKPNLYLSVLVLVCVLVATSSYAQNLDVAKKCEISKHDDNNLTLNCSRRNFYSIPQWPLEISQVTKDGHMLITFFNNSITKVTELPATPGGRIAISFKHNRITDIVMDAFQNLERLVYLDLSKNKISGDVLRTEIFRGSYNFNKYNNIALETLNLGHNEIHSLDRYLFQYTPNLTRLYLNNNPIELLDHVTVLAISSATNLEVLDLSHTDIDNIPLVAFKGLKHLQQIDLSGNKFTTVPETLSLVGSSLKFLSFNNNPIVELNDDSFIGLTNLIELEVAENDYLDEVKRSTFSPLKNLRVLHLCHNRNLRYISHNAFKGLKDKWTLKEVYLDDNDLSEISPDLMPWTKLDTLGMTGNNWLCNCDLADIVTLQGAGEKFKTGESPYCAAPLKLSGEYITNITLSFCPTFDKTFSSKRKFSITNLKPKQVLWSIFGVAIVACIGMAIGWLVKSVKNIYKKNRNQPVPYINLNSNSFA
ncbi:unnamed protein product [Chilo suppressalis]|uniref:LRRCT domain-containing protein n=1 Tax=Chilo suppressalis TaxID=168631 RepID=A0ABN8ECH5_CHISP|nr:unnamed protein product [Chilo suppressalis]